MCSTILRWTGTSSRAAAVSAAITAYPSMADRANGGTSIGETRSWPATRQAAAASGTRSVRAIGITAASRRRRASSKEIVEVNGRTSASGFADQGPELGGEKFGDGEPHGGLRARQRHDDAAGDRAGDGAAHHRGGA